MKALAAVKGVSADELTGEQIAAVNAELESEGFELEAEARGSVSYTQAQMDEATVAAMAEGQVKATSDKVAALEAAAIVSEGTIATHVAEIERLGKMAHVDTATGKAGDEVHTDADEVKTPLMDAIEAKAKRVSMARGNK